MTVLEDILRSTRADLEAGGRPDLSADLAARRRASGAFYAALAGPELSVIAEHKRRSPSAGEIRAGATVEQIIGAYERGGAAACSVLTEGPNFGGSLDDLRAARAATDLPLLRKDFIVDEYQLAEAAAAGADAVLLIVAALEQPQLAALHGAAAELGLDVLVEVHDRGELQRALELEPQIIGINNRDLRDFSVDPARTLALLPEIPVGALVVSESGLGSAHSLAQLREAGVHAVLVGEALMRAPDPESALRELF